jgi:large subunit ribosomal protein L11
MQIKEINQIDFSKITRKITLIVPAQNAKLGPPVGPVLGQAKIKVKDFCSLFNDYSAKYKSGYPLRVSVYVYKNESFDFMVNSPAVSFLLKNFINKNKTKKIPIIYLYKIALIKSSELKHIPLSKIFRNILIIAKSMKITLI